MKVECKLRSGGDMPTPRRPTTFENPYCYRKTTFNYKSFAAPATLLNFLNLQLSFRKEKALLLLSRVLSSNHFLIVYKKLVRK